MAQPAVVFDGVWKKFRRGERHDSLRDLVPSLVRRVTRGRAPADLTDAQDFWALRDVSFEVHAGEALGIIGPNGAGKSTTLKLLTKILKPTRGHALVQGRVGALIEVAAGFHPDLTGRENIFLQGAIMGMKRTEIARKLDEIIEFAGVADFIDTPVKRYSSGMNARLGFSIAAHLEPDVLIIDEVLSVGDMAFQRKCVNRMEAFRQSGIAIVFVSHDMAAVGRLCGNSIHLERSIRTQGPTGDVIREYLAAPLQLRNGTPQSAIEIENAHFVETGDRSASLEPGTALTLRVAYRVNRPVEDITFGLLLHRSTDGLVLYDGNFQPAEVSLPPLTPGLQFTVDYKTRFNVVRGQYHFDCHVYHNPTQTFLARYSPAGLVAVQETRTWAGVVHLDARIELASCNSLDEAFAGVDGAFGVGAPNIPRRRSAS